MFKSLHIFKNIKNINSIASRSKVTGNKNKGNEEEFIELPVDEVKNFAKECMIVAGACAGNAEIFADVMIDADIRGFFGHGLARLHKYVNDVMQDLCDGNAKPIIKRENAATAWVDGNNALGAVVGTFCVELAIKKAKEMGISLVACNNSNHFGTNSYYTNKVVREGCLGMNFSNTSPSMPPPGGKEAVLGTNPLSAAAPGICDESFVLDAATSAISLGKIELFSVANKPLPVGWALDSKGESTTDAKEALKSGLIVPLGAPYGSYKGFGLAMWAEIMSGILSDSKCGPEISKWGEHTEPRDLGHSFIVIDPNFFAPGFEHRLDNLIKTIRGVKRVDPKQPIQLPGDMERNLREKVDYTQIITYNVALIKQSIELSKKLDVKFPDAC